jgi:hypothetical protein
MMKFNESIEIRVILRTSSDGTIKVVEDVNSNYVVTQNEKVIGVYERKTDAYQEFGRLTRALKEQ